MSLSGRDWNTCLNHCLPLSKGQRRFRCQPLLLSHRPHRVRMPRLQFAQAGLGDFKLSVQPVFDNRSSFWVLWWVYKGPSRIETKSVTLDCGRYHGGIYNPRFGKCPLHIRGRSTRAIVPPERGQDVCVFKIFAWQPVGLRRIPLPGFTSWTFSP